MNEIISRCECQMERTSSELAVRCGGEKERGRERESEKERANDHRLLVEIERREEERRAMVGRAT